MARLQASERTLIWLIIFQLEYHCRFFFPMLSHWCKRAAQRSSLKFFGSAMDISEKNQTTEDIETPEVSITDGNPPDDELPVKKNGTEELEELRRLIVQPEEVGEVLPTAVEKRNRKDAKLQEATLPLVEENIRQSVLRDPKILAEALFPVIGPAIRKAISEALSSMVQNFNQTLEYSISPKSVRWRIEAFRTGKSFGEVVMLNTLVYRVEQVFLIHKETGILLQHASANPEDMQDADMVSAMLTAIEDFVQDSFKASDDATLDSLKIKELSVWIESSPDAIIAAVIRGNPPLSLRSVILEAIEKIQFNQERDLDNFSGETEIFERSRPVLEECLQVQSNIETKKQSGFLKPSNILLTILGLLILVGGFFYVRDHLRWTGFLNRLNSEKGIVVTEADRGFFTHSVSGLRDPLAIDPASILKDHGYEREDVEQNWKPYQDLSPEFVQKRAEQDLPEIIERIDATELFFECNTTELTNGQGGKIFGLAQNIEKVIDSGRSFQLEIHGFASSDGTEETNLEISGKRAAAIFAELKNYSSQIKGLQETKGEFIKVLAQGSKSEECKVTFKVKPQ